MTINVIEATPEADGFVKALNCIVYTFWYHVIRPFVLLFFPTLDSWLPPISAVCG